MSPGHFRVLRKEALHLVEHELQVILAIIHLWVHHVTDDFHGVARGDRTSPGTMERFVPAHRSTLMRYKGGWVRRNNRTRVKHMKTPLLRQRVLRRKVNVTSRRSF